MKYCLEFGIRGGAYTETQIIPTAKLAEALAKTLTAAFTNNPWATSTLDWKFNRDSVTRKTWQSKTHFVALSKLDGVPRGPASPQLWRKDNETQAQLNKVLNHV